MSGEGWEGGVNQRLCAPRWAHSSHTQAMDATCASAPLGGLIRCRTWIQSAATRPCVGFSIAGHSFNRRLRARWWAYSSQAMASTSASSGSVPPPAPRRRRETIDESDLAGGACLVLTDSWDCSTASRKFNPNRRKGSGAARGRDSDFWH